VLDRLLEDERIEIDGIRATSVGAMNAAVLASGLAVCGRAGARNALADFWRCVASHGRRVRGRNGSVDEPVC
jgi:NTE family protein